MSRTATGRGFSLEYVLPLLISGLLVATMAIGTLVAYLEVKNSAVETVRTRLELLTRDLSGILAPAATVRLALMREVAEDPAVRQYLEDPGPDLEWPVREALGRLHLDNQADIRIYLMNPERQPIVSLYPAPTEPEPPLPIQEMVLDNFGDLFEFQRRAYFWTATPILADADTLGFIAEFRRVGGVGDVSPFEALIGRDAQVMFGNSTGGGVWVTLDGQPIAPLARPFEGQLDYADTTGTEFFAHAETVPGMTWQVIAQAPSKVALARPSAFLRHAAFAALLVTLLGMAGAWIISRRITAPLRSLRMASEAIARGDYERRVELERSDEMGIVAAAYNHMAERVQQAHSELTAQYTTAQDLAVELDRASRAKSEFLATMSHEIRTPINAIIGYTDLLLLGIDGPVTDGQVAQLERIRVSGRHLVSLVDQVLDLARVESGRLDVQFQTSPIRDSVDTALTVLRPQAEAKGIHIMDECPDDAELWYSGDPQRVDQILVNLLSNAIKFTDGEGWVAIRCRRVSDALPHDGSTGEWICLTVEDRGPGIPREHLATIFEPFVQVESGYTRRHGGAGLGLSISLRLARSMGGDLTVESEVGNGSSFTLWLPAAEIDVERTEGAAAGGSAVGEA